MNYEKLYKEALEKAQKELQCCDTLDCDAARQVFRLFPKLCESEDERIRKALIEYFSWGANNNETTCNIEDKKILAWLEKQKTVGESLNISTTEECEKYHKAIDNCLDNNVVDNNTKPKFKVGDWLFHEGSGNALHISRIDNRTYISDEGATISFSRQIDWRLWTIQDAKDGDVLVTHECCVIFKEIDGLNIKCYCTYHYMGFNPSFYVDALQNKDAFHPATKEQRNFLFQKIKETGYEWDAEKKQLIKIV